MPSLTRITSLAGETILPLADAIDQAKAGTGEETRVAAARDAAIAYVEVNSGYALEPAQFTWTVSALDSRIVLPVGPATSVDAVGYYDAGGTVQAYADARLIGNAIFPAAGGSWPTAYDQVSITFTTGSAPPDKRAVLLQAVRLLVTHYFDQNAVVSREDMREIPMGVNALIGSVRAWFV